VQNAIIDGEIICLDSKGVSQFNQLLNRKGEPLLYAFDILWLDGEDAKGPSSRKFAPAILRGLLRSKN